MHLNSVFSFVRAVLVSLAALGFAAEAIAQTAARITTQPTNQSVIAGSNAVFTAAGSGQPPITLRWYREHVLLSDSPQIAGASSWALQLYGVAPSMEGNYWLVASNKHGMQTSEVARLTVLLPPRVVLDPVGAAVAANTNFSLSVTAEGTEPLTFRWYKDDILITDDSRITGASTATLGFIPIVDVDSGAYRVSISNAYGAVTSAVAQVRVFGPPTFSMEPVTVPVLHGGVASLSATAQGTAPMTYQWYKGDALLLSGGRISGATNATLTISNVQMSDAAPYQLVVHNDGGAITSSVAAIAVVPLRAWGRNFFGQTNIPLNLTNLIAADWGNMYSVALRTDGTLATWGAPTTIPADATNIAALAAGNNFNLVLRRDGKVVGWGYNDYGQSSPPTDLSNVVAVATGGYHSLALKQDGTVVGWGYNGKGQASPPAGLTNVIAISAGNNHSLAVKSDGTVVGFGYNYPYNQATPPGSLSRAIAIASGLDHNLALDGSYVTAWGDDYYGQVGTAYALTGIAQIDAGHFHSVALHQDGGLSLWGDNSGGQLNAPPGLSNIVSISGGSFGTLVVLENPLFGTPPAFVGRPFDRSAPKDGTTIFKPTITGSLPMTYRWYRNGTLMPGENNPWLQLIGLQLNQSGAYHLVASNRFGTATGETAVLTVELIKPAFYEQPQSQTKAEKGWVQFFATASGSTPLRYQWYHNHNALPGQNGTWMYLENLQTNHAGIYYNTASNGAGVATSMVATLSIVVPPAILSQSTNQAWLEGTNAQLFVQATGSEPLSYRWYRNNLMLFDNERITGSESNILSVANVGKEDAGTYVVSVANWARSSNSAPISVTVLSPPLITNQPASQIVSASTNVMFTVSATGTVPLAYQWRFEQSDLPGRTNTTLAFTNVQLANQGAYDVVVTNLYGAATSAIATLVVTPVPPVITLQPTSQVASVGQDVVFKVVAKGSEPIYCQWQRAGTNLVGETNFTMVLAGVNSSFAGEYRPILTNNAGTTFGTNALLSITPVVVWGRVYDPQLRMNASPPAAATNVIAIATAPGIYSGSSPCMALRADRSIVSWGYFSRDPASPAEAADVVAIAMGSYEYSANNIVLRGDGTFIQWPPLTRPPYPPTPENTNFVAVAAGRQHLLALRDDGTVVAWGVNGSGQTNVPPEATNVVAIAAGANHNLVLRADGRVIGWGAKSTTGLNDATGAVDIAAGGQQSFALLQDGSGAGWIVTNHQQSILGVPPPDATNLVAIAAGGIHTLGITSDDRVVGWGLTNGGQLNMPDYLTNIRAVAAGNALSLALVEDPTVPVIPPTIARPPMSRTITAGAPAVFNALGIGGPPLQFLWLKNDLPVLNQTNSWLHLPHPLPADAGDYRFVTMNAAGAVTSAVCTVSIALPRPTIKSLVDEQGTLRLLVPTVSGLTYSLEYANSLNSNIWQVRTNVAGNDSAMEILDDQPPAALSRFYRIVVSGN